MLQWNIGPLLLAKGVKKPYAWLRGIKMSHDVAHRILTGKHHRVDKVMISRICAEAWCTPNELFVWEPDANAIMDARHPLNKLKAKAISKLNDKLKKMTPEQIAALDKLADEMGGE